MKKLVLILLLFFFQNVVFGQSGVNIKAGIGISPRRGAHIMDGKPPYLGVLAPMKCGFSTPAFLTKDTISIPVVHSMPSMVIPRCISLKDM
jgi:hypothetical protein